MQTDILDVQRKEYAGDGVTVYSPVLHNKTGQKAAVNGFGFSVGEAAKGSLLLAFLSEWGKEFTPQQYLLGQQALSIETVQGRASHGYSPFAFVAQPDGSCLCVAVCWSGNWRLEFRQTGEIWFQMTPEMFSAVLAPAQQLALPEVIVAHDAGGFFALRDKLAYWLEENWFPPSRLQQSYVEWNHWWTYEDDTINEEVFCRNVDKAAELGIEICTLDAGWFGDPANPAHWSKCRGDWDIVNKERFPHGLRWLSDYVHSKGLKFGIWMEPEAMGKLSELLKKHPEWEARKGEEDYLDPYLCLGADGAKEWLYAMIVQIAESSNCDWFKFDFNIDPGTGCNRADHGHQPGMGLFQHYHAYYEILERLKKSHPHIIIENCSSGGLRLDLEMMRHADVSFLSDPDELAHSLQCLWGAGTLFSPGRLLHWAGSETKKYEDGSYVFPNFAIDEKTPEWEILAALRGGMLHRLGICRNLNALPAAAQALYQQQIAFYKEKVAPLVQAGRLYLLSGQPLRTGTRTDDKRNPPEQEGPFSTGNKAAAFQLQAKGQGCLLVFALGPAVKEAVKLRGLERDKNYTLHNADTGEAQTASGEYWMDKGTMVELPQNHSGLFMISQADS